MVFLAYILAKWSGRTVAHKSSTKSSTNEVNRQRKTKFDFWSTKKILATANLPKITQFQGKNSGTSEFPDLVVNLRDAILTDSVDLQMRWTATKRPNLTFDPKQKLWSSQTSQRSLSFKEKVVGRLSLQISLRICVARIRTRKIGNAILVAGGLVPILELAYAYW